MTTVQFPLVVGLARTLVLFSSEPPHREFGIAATTNRPQAQASPTYTHLYRQAVLGDRATLLVLMEAITDSGYP
jgi:hypothetical protein